MMKIFFVYNLVILLKNPFFFFRKLFFLIKYLLIGKKTFNIGGNKIDLPTITALGSVYDIFIKGFYNRINNLNCVLDLGGYIGESALYLSDWNKKVIVYEIAKDNFSYLEKNILQKKNIVGYNKGVVGEPNTRFIKFGSNSPFSVGGGIVKDNQNFTYDIACEFIGDILKNNPDIDGIKMDIEGGEYSIVNYFIKNNLFPFKKGIIEFHFNNIGNFNEFVTFLVYLGQSSYVYELCDVDNNLISTYDLIENKNKENIPYLHLFFVKIN